MPSLYTIRRIRLPVQHPVTLTSGQHYLFLLIASGSCRVPLNGMEHLCSGSDMLLLKPGAEQQLSTIGLDAACSLLGLEVSPDALRQYSDADCNLAEKYRFVPYHTALVRGEASTVITLKNLITRLRKLPEEELQLGLTIYENNLLSIFLVLFLRECALSDQVRRQNRSRHLLIDDVFLFIRDHLTEDLSIPRLEQEFYVSGEYLTRRFRATAGISVHAYIIKSRIDLSKKLLLQGMPIKEVYNRCGFGSYNHFFKVFKKECGMTPKEYYHRMSDIIHGGA